MKRFLFVAVFVVLTSFVLAQASGNFGTDAPQAESYIVHGPRVGVCGIFQDPAEFSSAMQMPFSEGNYYPVLSIFGYNFEYRILLGQTTDHFAVQFVFTIMGVEQSLFLPCLTGLIGYRHHSGFEFGIGPTVNVSGVGVVAALGYTIASNGVYIPIDIAFQIPNRNQRPSLSLLTGFNFR